jgi:hypothetical protein
MVEAEEGGLGGGRASGGENVGSTAELCREEILGIVPSVSESTVGVVAEDRQKAI